MTALALPSRDRKGMGLQPLCSQKWGGQPCPWHRLQPVGSKVNRG